MVRGRKELQVVEGNPGYQLRQLRAVAGISVTGLAKEFGYAKASISDVERGVRPPSIELLGKYAERFNVPLEQLGLSYAQMRHRPRSIKGINELVNQGSESQPLGESVTLVTQFLHDFTKHPDTQEMPEVIFTEPAGKSGQTFSYTPTVGEEKPYEGLEEFLKTATEAQVILFSEGNQLAAETEIVMKFIGESLKQGMDLDLSYTLTAEARRDKRIVPSGVTHLSQITPARRQMELQAFQKALISPNTFQARVSLRRA